MYVYSRSCDMLRQTAHTTFTFDVIMHGCEGAHTYGDILSCILYLLAADTPQSETTTRKH